MSFERLIEMTRARFPNNGRFDLLPAESIIDVLRREKVPNSPRVYAYFQRDDFERPLYIGKAGTMMTDGSWRRQGISERLYETAPRSDSGLAFRDLMAKDSPTGLTFVWFVTFDQHTKIIPSLIEMELLQAHYDLRGCLPRLNRHVYPQIAGCPLPAFFARGAWRFAHRFPQPLCDI
ncbi:MAG: hypothetical protein WBQ85_10430 [Candidatus Sulfotelmatobacter sp.]